MALSTPTIASITDNFLPVTGVVASGGSTNDTSPTIRVSFSGASLNYRIYLYNDSTQIGSYYTLSSADIANGYIDITLSGLANGTTFNFNAILTNNSGLNSSSHSSNYTIIIDTTAPSAPTLVLTVDNGTSSTDGITSNGSVTVSGLETGSTWQYSTNSGSTWSTGTGSSFTLAAGTYAIGAVEVKQTDLAGNVSSAGSNESAITIDTTAPSAPTLALTVDSGTSSTDGITSNGSVTVSG
ncbi:MAG: hypothetical protein WCG19_11250, partial [Chlorobiaceae bacterium]